MESADRIFTLADMLYDAERSQKAVPPITGMPGGFTVEDAYAVQMENIRRVQAMGQVISGKKIGLTSEGIQKQLGVNEPDYGHLFKSMDCPDGRVTCKDLIAPKIEAEIAFILKADLTGGRVTAQDVENATEYVVAAFEVVDSRIADWNIKLPDTVADNASSGRYILGSKKCSLQEIDLKAESMQLYKNKDELVGEGTGAAVLGNPCKAVAWLANKMYAYGVILKKGEVILSGAFSAAPLAKQGDIFEARFSTLGTVKAEFV